MKVTITERHRVGVPVDGDCPESDFVEICEVEADGTNRRVVSGSLDEVSVVEMATRALREYVEQRAELFGDRPSCDRWSKMEGMVFTYDPTLDETRKEQLAHLGFILLITTILALISWLLVTAFSD